MERHQSFARCPNGYHRSPSLVCEQITPSGNNGPYQSPTGPGLYQQQLPIQQQQLQNQTSSLATNPVQYPQQQQPQQNLSVLVQLANKSAVIACLNHVLVDSITKAGTTGSLTPRNNTNRIVTGGLNETFITNATSTLDACILPNRR